MKINKQKNFNEGDVFNIENINAGQEKVFQNINPYLIQEKVVTGKSVSSSYKESLVITVTASLGVLADLSELFSGFSIPWWLWVLVFLGAIFFYLPYKYGESCGVSKGKDLHISSTGEKF